MFCTSFCTFTLHSISLLYFISHFITFRAAPVQRYNNNMMLSCNNVENHSLHINHVKSLVCISASLVHKKKQPQTIWSWAFVTELKSFTYYSSKQTHGYADFSQDLLWNSASIFHNLIQRASVLITRRNTKPITTIKSV